MDTASLVISNSTDKSYQLADVVLDQTGRGANAWSKKRKHCDRWTVEETDRFYLGLQKFGTDFTMLAHWLGRCACVPACLRACVPACLRVCVRAQARPKSVRAVRACTDVALFAHWLAQPA